MDALVKRNDIPPLGKPLNRLGPRVSSANGPSFISDRFRENVACPPGGEGLPSGIVTLTVMPQGLCLNTGDGMSVCAHEDSKYSSSRKSSRKVDGRGREVEGS
ncbi:hypothetical protein TNCV_2464671 [Trichonephila clavipes]|nr:hypothetical protein TNCV_2464671 [Trichonephila clavipes]